MICNIRMPVWIATCLLFFSSIACLANDSERVSKVIDEISREVSVSLATADVLNARLKLEDWKLARLKSLHESGFATWLEVSRQQLLVDTLIKRRDAFEFFAGFTRALRQRALLASETLREEAYDRTIPPIKISLPGSVRLIGWIETDEGFSRHAAGPVHSVAPMQQRTDELRAATENLARAEKRCSALSSGGSVSEHWVRNAELQLALAEAELRLARMKQDADSQRRVVSGEDQIRDRSLGDQLVSAKAFLVPSQEISLAEVERLVRGGIDHSVTAVSHNALRQATLRVAEAETNATGELRAAEIALQRFELRLEALQHLQSEGFADRVELEVEDARLQVADGVLRVAQLRQQQKSLEQAYRSIQVSLGDSDLVDVSKDEISPNNAGSPEEIDLSAVKTWPLSLLTDVEFVRHLIELRREFCETISQRETLVLKLAMLERCLARVESIVEKSSTASGQPQHSIRQNDFKSKLLEGLRGEIQALQLDISQGSALRQAAEERLRILALEELRFMRQCNAQENGLDQDQFVGLNLADSLLPNQVRPTRYSYLESRELESAESAHELVFWRAANRDCTLVDFPSGIRLVDDGLRTAYRPSTQIVFDKNSSYLSRPLSANRPSSYHADHELRSARFNLPEQRDRTGSSYERAYPFGILRADLRSQQPVGFVPWYLPGSPTNYPYPNNRIP